MPMRPGEKITMGGEEYTAFKEAVNSCCGCAAKSNKTLCSNLQAHCGNFTDGVVFARSKEELTSARVAWKLAHA